ncbi:hypothetical protein [Micromonospora arida]|uniref:hypothetical protein n=1 Tax=Micromonospora arida TaxID=2203715 RepID=UPI0033BAFAF7
MTASVISGSSRQTTRPYHGKSWHSVLCGVGERSGRGDHFDDLHPTWHIFPTGWHATIDDSKGSPVDQILEQTGGMGADLGRGAVGHQAHDPSGQEKSALTLNNLLGEPRCRATPTIPGSNA